MGALFEKPPIPEEPVKGPHERIWNICKNNFRGIVGVVFSIVFGAATVRKPDDYSKLTWTWVTCFVWILLQTIPPSMVGLLPFAALPMFGIVETDVVCKGYFNVYVAILVIGTWCLTLFNNTGTAKRLMYLIMCGDKACSESVLLIKASVASFITSAISQRQIAVAEIMEILAPTLINMQSFSGKAFSTTCYDKYRYILCSAIHSAGFFGSFIFVHTNWTMLTAMGAYTVAAANYGIGSADSYNYFTYTLIALPLAVVLLVINQIYFFVLLKILCKPMDDMSVCQLHKEMTEKKKREVKKPAPYEYVGITMWILMNILLFSRSGGRYYSGWANEMLKRSFGAMFINDLCVFCLFALILHILPRTLNFTKYAIAKTRGDCPPPKPESGLLFWKIIDQKTPYDYLYLAGMASLFVKALFVVEQLHGVRGVQCIPKLLNFVTGNNNWVVESFFFTMVGAVLANIMTSVGAAAMLVPIAVCANTQYPCLVALCVGFGCSLGLISPFVHTPTYYSKSIAKTPLLYLAKYNIVGVVLSAFVVFIFMAFYAVEIMGFCFIGGAQIGSGIVSEVVASASTETTTLSTEKIETI